MESISIGIEAPEMVAILVRENQAIKGLRFRVCRHLPTVTADLAAEKPVPMGMMARRNPDTEEETILSRDRITKRCLLAKIRKVEKESPGRILTVSSRIELTPKRARELHIPMVDISCQVSEESLVRIRSYLKYVHQRGVILVSESGYQFYGYRLLELKPWIRFMGDMIEFSNHVNSRWAGHQLQDVVCNLRISKDRDGASIPRVIEVVE